MMIKGLLTFAALLPCEAFAIYDAGLGRVVEPGDFTAFVGPDSTTMNGVSFRLKENGGKSGFALVSRPPKR